MAVALIPIASLPHYDTIEASIPTYPRKYYTVERFEPVQG